MTPTREQARKRRKPERMRLDDFGHEQRGVETKHLPGAHDQSRHGRRGLPDWTRSLPYEGEGWTRASEAQVADGISTVLSHFPNAPKLAKVQTVDWTQFANAGGGGINVNVRFHDDEFMQARAADWGSDGVRTDPSDVVMISGTSRADVVVHEYGHVLEQNLPKAARKRLQVFLDEEVPGSGGPVRRVAAGLEAPTVYGTESQYEFVAEGIADFIKNGENAHPSSRFIGELMKEVYG